MKKPTWIAAVFYSAVLAWCWVIVSAPSSTAGDRVIATDALLLSSVAVVGILVARGRWARRLAIGIAAALPLLGSTFETGPLWWVALALSGASLAGLVGPGLAGTVRGLPSATGPPAKAVLLILVLLAGPAVIALSGPMDWIGWTAAALCLIVAGWYSKAAAAALLLVRTVPPIALLAVGIGDLGWILTLPYAALAAYLAWSAEARLAVHPLTERGRPVPILPEMVPKEILDAAGLDSRGRPKEDR